MQLIISCCRFTQVTKSNNIAVFKRHEIEVLIGKCPNVSFHQLKPGLITALLC